MRSIAMAVTSQAIEMPDELMTVNEEVTLCIDASNVNSLEILTTISHDMYCRSVANVWLPSNGQFFGIFNFNRLMCSSWYVSKGYQDKNL